MCYKNNKFVLLFLKILSPTTQQLLQQNYEICLPARRTCISISRPKRYLHQTYDSSFTLTNNCLFSPEFFKHNQNQLFFISFLIFLTFRIVFLMVRVCQQNSRRSSTDNTIIHIPFYFPFNIAELFSFALFLLLFYCFLLFLFVFVRFFNFLYRFQSQVKDTME